MSSEGTRTCKGPGCPNPLPLPQPGHKAKLTCSPACRKAASRAHQREEAQRQEEEARQQRLARWWVFSSATQHCLERIEVLGGAALAEQLAEAIWSEREQPNVTARSAVHIGHHEYGTDFPSSTLLQSRGKQRAAPRRIGKKSAGKPMDVND